MRAFLGLFKKVLKQEAEWGNVWIRIGMELVSA